MRETEIFVDLFDVKDFNKLSLEKERKNIIFKSFLILVSLQSMFTNLIRAFWKKVFIKRGENFKKILWEMGRDPNHYSSWFVDRFSELNHIAKVEAARWPCLEKFYNFKRDILPNLKDNLKGKLIKFWYSIENRQAVANRKEITKYILKKAIENFQEEPEIRILSIASGSAQAVLEAVWDLNDLNHKIKVMMIDDDASALERAQERIKEFNLNKDNFTLIKGRTTVLEEKCSSFKPHIIEMVGFLDYKTNEKAVILVKRIKNLLQKEGIFITCNIKKNIEKIFLDWVLLWPMIYKDEKDLKNILINAGFEDSKVKLIQEPLGIHLIAICQK